MGAPHEKAPRRCLDRLHARDPIEGARIEASAGGRTFSATTDTAGHFELFLGAGAYTVTALAFGYQSALATGVEIMDIFGEGALRLDNLDVAGRVGRWRALSLTFDAQVNDGLLVVRFARALGEPPILNSMRVTWLRA